MKTEEEIKARLKILNIAIWELEHKKGEKSLDEHMKGIEMITEALALHCVLNKHD